MKNLRRKAVAEFKLAVTDILAGDVQQFATRLIEAQRVALEYYTRTANDAILPGTSWSVKEDVQSFTDDLHEQSSKIRTEEMEKVGKRVIRQSQAALIDGVLDNFAEAGEELWVRIVQLYDDTTAKFGQQFKDKVAGFEPTEDEQVEYQQWILEESWDGLRNKLREELSDQLLQMRIRQRFE